MRDPEKDLAELRLEIRRRDHGANGPEARLECPFCPRKPDDVKMPDPSFAVNLTHGAWHCHRCNAAGNMFTLRDRLRGTGARIVHSATPSARKPQAVPPKIVPAADVARMESALWTEPGAAALAYLRSRKFTDETIKHFRLGARPRGASLTVAIPHFMGGMCVGVKYRFLPPNDTPKYAREPGCVMPLYGIDSLAGGYEKAIVTEGEFDAIALAQYFGLDTPVVSLPDGALAALKDDARAALVAFSDILICTDQDEKGDEGAEKLIATLGPFRCRRVRLPRKDANECLIDGVAFEEVKAALTSAAACGDSQVAHISSWRDEMINMSAEQTRGTTTGWPSLDRLIGGLRDGEVTLLTAGTGSGKTSWTIDFARRQGMAGTPVLIVSLEIPTKRVSAKLLSIVAGRRWDAMSPQERTPAADELCAMPIYLLKRYGTLAITEFRAEVEFAVRRYGVKVAILDHLHFALGISAPGEDERRAIDNAANAVQNIALEFAIHVVLVMHPGKIKADDTGRTRDPEIADLKGSSGPSQYADNVCRIARHPTNNSAVLKFLKVRSELAELGSVAFNFDKQTLRFEEAPLEAPPVAPMRPFAKPWKGAAND